MPFSAPHTLILPPSLTFQPVKSLPLKSGVKPSGAPLSSGRAVRGTQRKEAQRSRKSKRRMGGTPGRETGEGPERSGGWNGDYEAGKAALQGPARAFPR